MAAEDLDRLGEAAFWTGHQDESVALREQAYGAYAREGKNEAAAMVAMELYVLYKYRLAKSVAKAWFSRAERLLADKEETAAYGHLLRWRSVAAFESEGNSQKGIALAEQVRDAGIRLGDRNLEALGLQDKGRFLVAMGHIEKGLCLVDEAMIAAVAGELDPQTTGRSYCNMLAVCVDVADYERAAEWSDAARSWCDDQPDAAYPGICRMFRAELTWLSGSWDDAAEECRRAISELAGFTPIIGQRCTRPVRSNCGPDDWRRPP